MGDDTLAPISEFVRSPCWLEAKFAQVTNPPIDSLREKYVMSLETCIGPELDIFEETSNMPIGLLLTSYSFT